MAKEEAQEAPKKNKAKLFIIIGLVAFLMLGIGGGAAAFFLMSSDDNGSQPEKEVKAASSPTIPAKYVELGTFTTNLAYEDGTRIIQTNISVKVDQEQMEKNIKDNLPAISHAINLILQSKKVSDLAELEGKNMLALQILRQIEYAVGMRRQQPPLLLPEDEEELKEFVEDEMDDSGVKEVLFTSMIIQ